MVPVALIFGILGNNFKISIYGIETDSPLSFIGLGLVLIFIFKAFVAYGLWMEKDWAINAGIADASIGILICAFVMLILPLLSPGDGFNINFRLELILLIPYLLKMLKLKSRWNL